MAKNKLSEDVFDTAFDDADFDSGDGMMGDGMPTIPSKLFEVVSKLHDRIQSVRVRRFTESGSWKFVSGIFSCSGMDKPSVTRICKAVMELTERAIRSKSVSDSERFQAYLLIGTNKGETPKTVQYVVSADDRGDLAYEDDVEHESNKSEVQLYRALMEDHREFSKDLQSAYLKDRSEFSEQVRDIAGTLANVVSQVASIAEGIAKVTNAAAASTTSVVQLYEAQNMRSAEVRKLELDAEIAREESASANQRTQMGFDLLKMAAPMIMAQVFKMSPEQAMGLFALMSSGPGAMAGMKALSGPVEPLSKEESNDSTSTEEKGLATISWDPPEKPGFDPKKPEDQWDLRDALAYFFVEIDREKEIRTRQIVGAPLYDRIREASARDEKRCKVALKAFLKAIEDLPQQQRPVLAANLVEVLGQELGMYFLGITQRATR